MRNKIFTKIIITTLLVTFLTFNVGRVTRVSAVGTTAAIASTAFLLTGAVYLSYVALTQGEMVLPAAEELHDWLGGIGRKVSKYPSGAEAYQDIYQGLLRDPTANVIDGVWTWTQDRIKSFINDFSDTRIISDILAYEQTLEPTIDPTNGFDYPFSLTAPVDYIWSVDYARGGSLSYWVSEGYNYVSRTGPYVIYETSPYYTIQKAVISSPVRNLKSVDGYYYPQILNNGVWQSLGNFTYGDLMQYYDRTYTLRPEARNNQLQIFMLSGTYNRYVYRTAYPLFPYEVIHDEATDKDLPMVIPEDTVTRLPSWVDPDNDNRPIVPWVPIPNIPTGIPTPPGYTGVPQWGFPLQDLLDLLEELARGLINIGAIGELINEFAGLHGDEYYLYYNEGDTNYYTYYQPTIFDNDTEYVTYNINVSEQEDIIPVDLNTISLYTQNRYLEQIKNSAIAGSSMLRDLAVFWYDVDPEVTYIVLGCCILVLIGAFTGKLGHS